MIGINYVLDLIHAELNDAPYAPFKVELAGSAEKDTFNEGISDIDLRAVTDNGTLLGLPPRVAKKLILKQIASIDEKTKPRLGHQTVTISKKGHDYQIIPVVKSKGTTYVPSEDGRYWKAVDLHAFDRELHKLNKRTGGRFCEAVRFVKILSNQYMPKQFRLSGYHIETMALEILRNCPSSMDRTKMVDTILNSIPSRVRYYSPDITGETKAVDHDLGSSYNNNRKYISKHYRNLRDIFRQCRQTGDMDPLDESGR